MAGTDVRFDAVPDRKSLPACRRQRRRVFVRRDQRHPRETTVSPRLTLTPKRRAWTTTKTTAISDAGGKEGTLCEEEMVEKGTEAEDEDARERGKHTRECSRERTVV